MRPAGAADRHVTFLFTDIEGSTRLLHELGADAYAGALRAHRRVLREAFASHGGVVVDSGERSRRRPSGCRTVGGSVAAFERARPLLDAADEEFLAGVQEGRRPDIRDAVARALGEAATDDVQTVP